MKRHVISRIITAALFGILVGSYMHYQHLKRAQDGRQVFMARQAERFDRESAYLSGFGPNTSGVTSTLFARPVFT
jgi:hypothetical protein